MYPGQQWNQQQQQQQQRPPQQNPNVYVVNAQQQPMGQPMGQPIYQQQPMGQVMGQPQPQVVYMQQPPQQQTQYAQPQVVYMQQQPQQPPVQYIQQQPPQQMQQPVQYVQQGQPQYGGQPQPQYVQSQQTMQPQYAQPPQQAAPGHGGVYPQVQKNAGPPPPSYTQHQQKKNIYEMADEKMNTSSSNKSGGGVGGVSSKWTQPRPDAKGSVPALSQFNDQIALQKAQAIHKAMKGLGCNKNALIEITGTMNLAQRLAVRRKFDTVVDGKRNLLKWLKSELSGNLEDLVIGLYRSQGEYDAYLIEKALSGMGFNSELLIEVVCTRTWSQICNFRKAWVNMGYTKAKDCTDRQDGKYLTGGVVKAVDGETKKMMSGNHFQSLMNSLLTQKRPDNQQPDPQQVTQDAETLNRYIKQEKKSAQKDKFVEIYTGRSWAHLAALSERFSDVSKKWTLSAAIKHAFGDGSDTSQALQVITSFVSQPYDYWAAKIRKSMKGLGTNDNLLIRLLVSRSEVDMQNVKTVFGQRYGDGQTLKKWLQDDISGHYQKLCLHITGYID